MSAGTEETRALPVDEEEIQDGSQASDSSKLKTLLTILKRTVGVKDLASLYVPPLTQPPLAAGASARTDGRLRDSHSRISSIGTTRVRRSANADRADFFVR